MNNAQLIGTTITVGTGIGAFYLLKHFKKPVLLTFPIAAGAMVLFVIYAEQKEKKLNKGVDITKQVILDTESIAENETKK
jgi:hypothetical protein